MDFFQQNDWCSIFCCPPCPSKIASKLAFFPPKPSTYSITCKNGKKYNAILSHDAQWDYTEEKKNNLEWFLTKTRKGNTIACLYVNCTTKPLFTIIFSHGSGVDLGIMSSIYFELGCNLNCNIISYDYSGYGVSTGRPSEKNLYADIDAIWNIIQKKYKIKPNNIILYGQSIGTVPTIDLASRINCAGVILHSALMSGLRIAFPNIKKTWCFDAFPNIDKVKNITAPVLVIHGTNDEIIDISHSIKIYKMCPITVKPLWINGGQHDDLELYTDYLERLECFINKDLHREKID